MRRSHERHGRMRRAWGAGLSAAALWAALAAQAAVERTNEGVLLPVGSGWLQVTVRSESIMRVAYALDRAEFAAGSLAVLPEAAGAAPVQWKVAETAGEVVVATGRVSAHIDRASGAVAFLDARGTCLASETPGGRSLDPAPDAGPGEYHVRQRWLSVPGEAFYGLGQHQEGALNIKGRFLDLWQHNTAVAVPMLVSSRGYGLYWDNPSYTRFGDLGSTEPIPPAWLADAAGDSGCLTGTYFSDAHFGHAVATRADASVDLEHRHKQQPTAEDDYIHSGVKPGDASVRWEGSLTPRRGGDVVLQARYTGGLRVWINGRLVIDHWRQGWLPSTEEAPLHLEAGRRYSVRIEWVCDQAGEMVHVGWRWLAPDADTSLWSEAGRRVDYYFIYGPGLDQVVGGYRELTGRAPMMPIWAFGLWQSRQRYKTQGEILDVARGFRSRGIPLDVIVQDWFYWKADAWGSHAFDPERFPDPDAMIRTLHDSDHLRYMISVWPKFYPGTDNFNAMQAGGFLYQPNLTDGMKDWVGYRFTFYDAFNPEARSLYWRQIDRALFRRGVDAWWLDASEPDMLGRPSREGLLTHMVPTAAGRVETEMNAYPLLTTGAVHDGQRAEAPNQRVVILTRSAYAGQQRNAAATWSGDISSTWTAMRKQIPAGLGFSLSGIPYWTMDTGGFAVPPRWSAAQPAPEDLEEWRELNARWFEFAAFVPILRVHGEFPNREMWELGGEASPAYQAELKFDRLRYRLLPYLYSEAAQVTFRDGTLLRPLVMDFPDDPAVLDISDEYQFGPAFLVSPVTSYRTRQRSVYLPKGTGWYDFWTGAGYSGGQLVEPAAPLDQMPLHVRAGSIIPLGPDLQYSTEKPADPITLVIYAGADGAFELYEDDGLTNAYETGACSRIGIRWNDAAQTLDIGGRQGSFDGMLRERTFRVVRVSLASPVGYPFPAEAEKTIRYSGEAVTVRLDAPGT